MAVGTDFYSIKLIKGGTISGDDKATGSITTSNTYYTFGSSSDIWGNTLTVNDVNSSTFGVGVSFVGTGDSGITQTKYLTATNFGFAIPSDNIIDGIVVEIKTYFTGTNVYVDHIRMTVYYTEGSSSYITRAFAVYTDSEPAGTTKIGNILTGDTSQPYGAGQPANTDWYMGPDETNGYIVAKDNGTEPTFWRSTTKTDNDFVALANSLKGDESLSTIGEARTWLSSNGYYYDNGYVDSTLILDFDDQPSLYNHYITNTEIVNVDSIIYVTVDDPEIDTILFKNDTGIGIPFNNPVTLNVGDELYFNLSVGAVSYAGIVTIRLNDIAGDIVDTFTYNLKGGDTGGQ